MSLVGGRNTALFLFLHPPSTGGRDLHTIANGGATYHHDDTQDVSLSITLGRWPSPFVDFIRANHHYSPRTLTFENEP